MQASASLWLVYVCIFFSTLNTDTQVLFPEEQKNDGAPRAHTLILWHFTSTHDPLLLHTNEKIPRVFWAFPINLKSGAPAPTWPLFKKTEFVNRMRLSWTKHCCSALPVLHLFTSFLPSWPSAAGSPHISLVPLKVSSCLGQFFQALRFLKSREMTCIAVKSRNLGNVRHRPQPQEAPPAAP